MVSEKISKYGNPGRSKLDRPEVKLRYLGKDVKCLENECKTI